VAGIRWVPGSTSDRDTAYPDRDVFVVSSLNSVIVPRLDHDRLHSNTLHSRRQHSTTVAVVADYQLIDKLVERPTSLQFCSHSWNLKDHYHVQKSPPLVLNLA